MRNDAMEERMGWNYRLIRTEDGDEACYAVHEVYYDSLGRPKSWTEEPASILSEDRLGILEVLANVSEAVGQPVFQEHNGALIEVEEERIFRDDLRLAMQEILDHRAGRPMQMMMASDILLSPTPPGARPTGEER